MRPRVTCITSEYCKPESYTRRDTEGNLRGQYAGNGSYVLLAASHMDNTESHVFITMYERSSISRSRNLDHSLHAPSWEARFLNTAHLVNSPGYAT